MEKPFQFLRFSGRLWENMVFEKEAGWETKNVAQRPPEGDGEYQLELLDEEGKTLVAISPQVDFQNVCLPDDTEMRRARVVAYLPWNEQGRELIFRRADRVLHQEKVSKEPPSVQIEEVAPQRGSSVRVMWGAKHPEGKPLSFNVIYLVDKRRSFLVAKGLKRSGYTANLKAYPGSKEGRLAVLATDGTRSAFDVSKAFPVEDKPPQVWIQKPGPNDTLPADQPIDLSGQALDVAGASLPDEHLLWRVDGEVVARGKRRALVEALEPGRHKVTLEYAPKGQTVAEQSIAIRIAKRSAEQERFRDMLKTLPELGGEG